MRNLFGGTFEGLTVLLTGHTGFKGSWLTIWLNEMGANVVGYSLPEPPTVPSNYELAGVAGRINAIRGDVRDLESLRRAIQTYRPALVIHFAAQSTVLGSYQDPKSSFDTNVGGTINVLEAVRTTDAVKAVVVCTTDKVYENKEWVWGYRETDELGGYDPYSSGKAMAELAVAAYRNSFFSGEVKGAQRRVAVGTVRAGNVIGGGDFTENGLVADAMRALLRNENVYLRHPTSTRPWQYVLEPLSGYLCLAERLLKEGQAFAEAWNFGPLSHSTVTTSQIVEKLIERWDAAQQSEIICPVIAGESKLHEAHDLRLNWDKAARLLHWQPVYSLDEALNETVKWYRAFCTERDLYGTCTELIETYVQRARQLDLQWAC